MRQRIWTRTLLVLPLSLLLSGCALLPGVGSGGQSGASERIALCTAQDEAVSFTVYNHYAGSDFADKHTVSDPQEVAWACDEASLWARLAAEPQDYVPDGLHERLLTVVVITGTDGSEQSYWAYRQPWYPAQTVLITGEGQQFLIPNQSINPYYAPTAETIPAAEVPKL